MATYCYLALLRGINVGGSNIVPMIELRKCFENIGCTDVRTYIQSGNVLFRTGERNAAKLVAGIERALASQFEYPSRVVVLALEQLRQVVSQAPPGFGKHPDRYSYDVIFLKQPLTAAVAIKSVSVRKGVDTAHAGKGVLYFSRLASQATKSHLRKIITLPIYQQMTIRNWNTTTKLLTLMNAACTEDG